MSIYRRKNSAYWLIDLDIPGFPRVRRPSGTTDEAEAQRIHDELKEKVLASPRSDGTMFGDFVMVWAATPDRGEPDLLAIKKFSRYYTDRPLAEVTRESLDKALRQFCTTPSTYTRYRNRLHAILQLAVDAGKLQTMPRLATWESKRRAPVRWLTQDEWRKFWAELPDHSKRICAFALATGLRRSNVLDLEWSAVDLERRIAWVHAIGTKANRNINVPLNDLAVEILRQCQGRHDTYVFTYQGSKVKDIRTSMRNAAKRAGIPHLGMHALRHTFATWHVMSGTPLSVLKELGSWASFSMVDNYTHLSVSHLAQYANNSLPK